MVTPVGLANANPILDTREYTFTFIDGDETVLNANLIAEAMYAQCDPNGNQYVLLDSISDQTRPDQTRPDQTRPDQTRPDQTRPDLTRPDQIRPDLT